MAGYWQPLIGLLDHIVAEGFADPSIRGLFTALPDLDSLDRALHAAYESDASDDEVAPTWAARAQLQGALMSTLR